MLQMLAFAVTLFLLLGLLEEATAQWTLIAQDNPPGQRFGSAAIHCAERDSMIMFSGFKYFLAQDARDSYYQALDDLWEYSFASKQWTAIPQPTKPVGRVWASFTSIPTNNASVCAAVLIGGATRSPGPRDLFVNNDEMWLLTVRTGQSATWKRLTPTNVGPGMRNRHQTVYRRGTLVLVGGHQYAEPANLAFDDMWEMDAENVAVLENNSNLTWRRVTPSTAGQIWVRPRFGHTMGIHIGSNSTEDKLVVFGGTTYVNSRDVEVLTDVCVYQFSTNRWYIPSGVKLERSAHGSILSNGKFWVFGGNTQLRISASMVRTFVFDDLLMTDLLVDPPIVQSSGSQLSPGCRAPDGKTGLWCTAFPQKDQVRPLVRFNFVSIQRGNHFVVYGGLFKDMLGDFWTVDTATALPTLVVSEEDVLEGGADLASTVYFMIAILSMMVVCFVVFVVSLRRHRNAHPVFIIGLTGANGGQSRPVGARQSVIDALPLKTYHKAQAAGLQTTTTPATAVDADSGSTTTTSQHQAIVDPVSTAVSQATPATGSDDIHGLCAICLTDYEDGETIRVLPCQHFFHPACVDQWLASRNVCPMCKAVVDPDPEREASSAAQNTGGGNGANTAAVAVELTPTSPTNRDGEGRPTASV